MAETAREAHVLERRRLGHVGERRRLELRVALDDGDARGARLQVGVLAGDAIRAGLLEVLDELREALEVLDLVAALDDADTVLREDVVGAVRVVVCRWKRGEGRQSVLSQGGTKEEERRTVAAVEGVGRVTPRRVLMSARPPGCSSMKVDTSWM